MINIVCRAWDRVGKKNMKERAKEEMKRGGYDEWLKERVSIVGLPFPEMDKQVEELEEQRVEELRQSEELLKLRAALKEVEEKRTKLEEKVKEIKKKCEIEEGKYRKGENSRKGFKAH